MSNVILQPASGIEPREHYQDTVDNPVALSRIRSLITNAAFESLSIAIGTDSTCVWGITPSMVSQWKKIRVGDKVMFARDNRFFSLSTVTWKTNSHRLAVDLWGFHDSGDTWEFIYFFGPPEDINIPYTDINAAVPDRKPGAVPQGVTVLSSTKAQAALGVINQVTSPISYSDFGDAPNDNPSELQTFSKKVRRGQAEFRSNLLGAYGSKCVITGEGPEEVLEAVHIVPHSVSGINELDNGLLMRADLHHLFDDGLLTINPISKTVEMLEMLEISEISSTI